MRIVLALLLALAVVAAPAAQAAACRCEAEPAAREAADPCCCGDAKACDCCGHDEPPAPARTMAGCPCAHEAPLSSETADVELPAPIVLATLPAVPASTTEAASAIRPAPVAPGDPHPEVRAPLLL